MSILFDFEEHDTPKSLRKQEIFEVPSDVIIYGTIISGSMMLLVSIFIGLFVGGV